MGGGGGGGYPQFGVVCNMSPKDPFNTAVFCECM